MHLELFSQQPEGDPQSTHSTPLLFVHGAWHGSWCWKEHFLPYFAQHGYVSYTFDLRGHGIGTSGKHLRWTRIADYVADVEQINGSQRSGGGRGDIGNTHFYRAIWINLHL